MIRSKDKFIPILTTLLCLTCLVSVLGQGYYSVLRSFAKDLSFSAAVLNYFSYFTVWTNTLMGLFLVKALSEKALNTWWLGLFTYSLLFLSLVYYALIDFDPVGFERLYDFGLHALNPFLALTLWIFLSRKDGDLDFKKVWSWSFYPLTFVGFSLIRNQIDGWAPYFFLDPKVVGTSGLFLYIIALTLVFLLGASLFLWGSSRASRRLDLKRGC